MTPPVIGRLAPSPTGAQHLGNARTYCLAYWAARSSGGTLRFRIEDIDTPRTKNGAADQAVDDLRWLGIRWSGEAVFQTRRLDRYQNILDQFRRADRIYPCVCSRKDIESSGSAPHFEHEGPIYPGTCSRWRNGDSLPDQAHCWRFRTDASRIEFDDECLGRQHCIGSTQLGDFPITQKNGLPAYQLAVVVDDYDAGITQVVRGNDLSVSTFRQLLLHRELGWQPPRYAHVPLVVGPDGRRLAKRHGDTRLSKLRDDGVDPIRIVRWAAESSGLTENSDAITSIDDVINAFDWQKIAPEDTVVEPDRFV